MGWRSRWWEEGSERGLVVNPDAGLRLCRAPWRLASHDRVRIPSHPHYRPEELHLSRPTREAERLQHGHHSWSSLAVRYSSRGLKLGKKFFGRSSVCQMQNSSHSRGVPGVHLIDRRQVTPALLDPSPGHSRRRRINVGENQKGVDGPPFGPLQIEAPDPRCKEIDL